MIHSSRPALWTYAILKVMSGKTSNGKNYPWDKWFQQGTSRTLKLGRDFHCSVRSMVVYIYTKARANKVRVMVETQSNQSLKLTVHDGSLDGRSK